MTSSISFSALPLDILSEIGSYIPTENLLSYFLLEKRTGQLSQSSTFWKHLLMKKYPDHSVIPKPGDAKWIYLSEEAARFRTLCSLYDNYQSVDPVYMKINDSIDALRKRSKPVVVFWRHTYPPRYTEIRVTQEELKAIRNECLSSVKDLQGYLGGLTLRPFDLVGIRDDDPIPDLLIYFYRKRYSTKLHFEMVLTQRDTFPSKLCSRYESREEIVKAYHLSFSLGLSCYGDSDSDSD